MSSSAAGKSGGEHLRLSPGVLGDRFTLQKDLKIRSARTMENYIGVIMGLDRTGDLIF